MIDSKSQDRPAGFLTTLRAALNAGLLVGLMHGLLDGVVAGRATHTSGVKDWAGCLALSVLTYDAIWIAVLLLLSPAIHFAVRRRALLARVRVLTAVALGLAAFIELFWWSRPYVYSGLSATDPRRLAAASAMLLIGLGLGYVLVHFGKQLPKQVKVAAIVLIPLSWFGGAIYALGQKAAAAHRGELNDRNRDLPNVLLIVCDALRADVLGTYGNTRVKTPVIDALAARGVVFENAIVQAPFTWASFGSILTGKYPRRHGLVKMEAGVRMVPNVTLPWHLKTAPFLENGPLHGQRLVDGDFYGATFMTGTLSHGSRLDRGFDAYYEGLVGHELVVVDDAWSVFRSELLFSIVRNKLLQKLDSNRVASVACEWFEDHGKQRFVSMVHFYSTHTPYDPPAKFRSMYCDPQYRGPISAFYAEHRIAIESGQGKLEPADRAQIQNLYYAGVSQADAMIGEVLDALKRQGVLERTLVIVTGDHGEELGDHDRWEHNWMYQTNLRVPLVVALPGRLAPGTRVNALVESVDIVPTVCALLGVAPPPERAAGSIVAPSNEDRERIDGVDLLPLVRGEVTSVKAFGHSENGLYLGIQDGAPSSAPDAPRYKLVVRTESLDEAAWQASLAGHPERPQLYRLDTDPGETKNLIDEEPAQAARLLEALRAFDMTMPIPRSDVAPSARDIEEEKARLRSLGYADGIGQGAGVNAGGDPKRQ